MEYYNYLAACLQLVKETRGPYRLMKCCVCIQLLKQAVGWSDQSSSGLQLISLRKQPTFRDAITNDVCWS